MEGKATCGEGSFDSRDKELLERERDVLLFIIDIAVMPRSPIY